MRNQLLKINVSPKQFKKIRNSHCGTAEFLSLSDNLPIEMWDFIVFTDSHGRELLRHMSKMDQKIIHYTNYSDFYPNSHFPLAAALCHLYESIMYLRLNTYTDENRFPPNFPPDIIKQKMDMIQLCLDLLENNIAIKQFTDKLDMKTADDDNYLFKSSAAIMKLYSWDFQLSERNRCFIDKIYQASMKINKCLEHKEEWKNIWRLAYDIHNLPSSIYHNFVQE